MKQTRKAKDTEATYLRNALTALLAEAETMNAGLRSFGRGHFDGECSPIDRAKAALRGWAFDDDAKQWVHCTY